MINSDNRFHGYGSLNYLFRRGSTVRAFFITLRHTTNPRRKKFRAAVIVARKVAKSSPQRNRIRRRIYEIIREVGDQINPQSDFALIIYDAQAETMPSKDLKKLVLGLLKKANVITTVK